MRRLFQNVSFQVLKETCTVFRHLILDDDIRIEFSKAHDHARAIASDVLAELTELLTGWLLNKLNPNAFHLIDVSFALISS